MALSATHKLGIAGLISGVLYALSDVLIEYLPELIHSAFEAIEWTIDVVIEHIFHTDLHTTQIITFYLMLLIAVFILYRLIHRIPYWLRAIKNTVTEARQQVQEQISDYWHEVSAADKLKCLAVLMLGLGLMLLGLLS
ncbi:MAG: hypothetical protein CVV13_11380 [Gammaproteobacteria bacterium HGW-Gammaproteobacteria-3]|nr:MAG: hypothetical protein CVV13_11380 [Gammaproteobacteria bacterium HGW-Gammaproteobacteria-3]